MLCQNCQQNAATVHLRYEINGNEKTFHLCEQCYRQQQDEFSTNNPKLFISGHDFSIDSLFNAFPINGNGFETSSSVAQKVQTTGNGRNGFLDRFGKNVTEEARRGKIDPVIGRDEEMKKVMEILNRRNKNNPVLIGEPGVGKTAVVEGLALKIASKNVPMKLRNKELYLLDVASLVANTGIRGQFEERMKQLIAELQHRREVILFIDEIHLLVGAGSAEGSMDAGNILKPALARGDIQIIGATTVKEYRHIEKDAALERRFQPVLIQEPSVEATIDILMGLKSHYEQYHHVKYSDEAIRACVNLSHRYIQDRFLPDKAIDLMDEAGSKVNLNVPNLTSKQIEERLHEIAVEKKQALQSENYERAAKLRDEEMELEKRRREETNVQPIVDIQIIQEILEEKTGIPVGKIQTDEQQKLKHLDKNLGKKVIGQNEAVRSVAKAIRRARAGLKAKNRPIGSFLFVGPTGVGKTELAKTLAEQLYGTRNAMIRLDMSEYMEKHSVSKLIGSPPGYVGHEEAGQLTEKVRRNPYSLILLDEIEKAHPDVMHVFLQILDDGRLTDSHGRTVSFKDTVIIMTSNAGTEMKNIRVGFGKQQEKYDHSSNIEQLRQYFKPEFLNRFDDIIRFHSLNKNHLLQIVDLMLQEVKRQLAEENIELTVEEEVKEKLVDLGFDHDFGARPLRRAIQEHLEDPIADFVLDHPHIKQLTAKVVDETITISE
ncbi:ATP-dependent Clp protease ATP-binding subunit [Fervidibacillus albus]|uniref:AAA family ATPase n=1 Tax=Fervidibacillus albus TaxID=2980026 RepID=A0A9E8RWX1_9BACI|nr:ATP-dependent Clp protease ATP-binding subunit [Fervidibacillus albus]WAA11131.1 AAA family ATPase [Fervidibacillus albus]